MSMKQVDPAFTVSGSDKALADEIFKAALDVQRRTPGLESLGILEAYGIPVVKTVFAKTEEEAVKAAEEMGYPLVMKVVSPQISHKSDVGGIRLSLQSGDEVRAAYLGMMEKIPEKRPDAVLEGVQIQKMLSGGNEVIIGMIRDPTFGPMLMFGLGGVYVEILKDVRFAIAPVNEKEAREMIKGIKAYPLLAGARGAKPSDIDALVDAILRISRLVCDFPEIEEFEINPMMVLEERKGAFAVDMRLTLKKN
ncbi:acetate--CoA ligase family protein [Methanosarcina mazei]|uniref:acetate--CoA ligase (ADP-forming) n=1 Tax=Methanosarcina mazei TaxID=2209 RepID=A0A0F8RDT4_METMZ|nr:acetate--CoA ligase family protein [Methanosarcina mazei]KKG02240.1 acetyl-CoA synthetase [Methanosarcina mazei]KKG03773.1 acetyl-CoA synthetase [Methanosarcina mazei]KKG08880.1 acetyl-CoA synthetase [Methanosarcina mazei]KKG56782.1 acetyl-CoA synthetase [Methanosarcina mazei]KKG59240.1 acetyl-CoA synthetase [Methanosarcina mazei]